MKTKQSSSIPKRKPKSSQWILSVGSRYEKAVKRLLLKSPPPRTLARQIALAVVNEMSVSFSNLNPPFNGTTLQYLQSVQAHILAGTDQDDKPKASATDPDHQTAP